MTISSRSSYDPPHCVTKPTEAAAPRSSILVYLCQSFSVRHFLLCPPGTCPLSPGLSEHAVTQTASKSVDVPQPKKGGSILCAGAGRLRCQWSGMAHRWQIRLTDRTGGSKQNSEKRHPSAEECSHGGGAIIPHLFFLFFFQGKQEKEALRLSGCSGCLKLTGHEGAATSQFLHQIKS